VFVRYNRGIAINVNVNVVTSLLGPKISIILIRYCREFVTNVMVMTKFECVQFVMNPDFYLRAKTN